jgi:hypothetical protein
MKDGFYKVAFHALQPGSGGVVVLRDGQVQGADAQFLYSGSLTQSGDDLSASLTIAGYVPGASSVFGTGGNKFQLQVTGKASGSGFQLSGNSPVSGQPPIQIYGTLIAQLPL